MPEPGAVDRVIDAAMAQRTQDTANRHNVLLLWTVTWGTADFGERFVARPQIVVAALGPQYMRVHLEAESLDELRAQLPRGLTRLAPEPGDDTVIVEVWL
jgi:hypothetical protein